MAFKSELGAVVFSGSNATAKSTRLFLWVEEIISPLKASGLLQVEGYLKMSLGENAFAGL